MADYKKILDHPEVQGIIDKLMMGETPKDVSAYLKHKYNKPDENHLRLSASLLEQFVKNYCNTSDFMTKIVKDEKKGALDKQIAQSLMNNKTWKERLAELADDKIDLERKLAEQLAMMEQRQEQIFDKIQENPGSTKLDYVMTKYFELNMMIIEKIEKIVNKAPDQRIEHTVSVQMVEQYSSVLQEGIRRVIARLPAEQATEFMEMLSEEMASVKPPRDAVPVTMNAAKKEVARLEDKGAKLDAKFEEIGESDD